MFANVVANSIPSPLIRNSGGYISTWEGKDPKIGGSIVASSNKKIHKKILNILKSISK